MAEGNISEELNERQYQAVSVIDGPILVIAGAGSGKTRVIEYRVRYLVESGVSPSSILLLTFTRRSAAEMISRAIGLEPCIAAHFGNRPEKRRENNRRNIGVFRSRRHGPVRAYPLCGTIGALCRD